MGTLNIVNKSTFEKRTLEQCLGRIADGDSVLLIEDAAAAAIEGTAIEPGLRAVESGVKLYVLKPDLEARGLAERSLVQGMSTVDYAGFVDLVVSHDRVHSWL